MVSCRTSEWHCHKWGYRVTDGKTSVDIPFNALIILQGEVEKNVYSSKGLS